jgi:hypothetical protein
LIDALLKLQGKQANITIHMEEKDGGQGRKFLAAFARVTEMVPRDAGGGKTAYVSKGNSAAETAANVRASFNSKG